MLLGAAVLTLVCFQFEATMATMFNISLSESGPFDHFWKRAVGSGHALLGTRSDWQQQLRDTVTELGFERVRMHGIFDDDMSVVLSPGRYEFYNVDVVYDFLLSINVRPIVELSFMPGILAGCWPWTEGPNCMTVMHYQGVVQPPTNFTDWRNLCAALAGHLVDRYGLGEVSTWGFEVWNELWGMDYPTEYLQLYNSAYDGIKSVSSSLNVGGPATMQCQYVAEFVSDTAGRFDFISTHLYPTDPNCTGSSDINCFANTIIAARNKAPATTPFFLTEYNAGLFNTTMLYSSYAAAFVFRYLPQLHNVLNVWSYWTFSDIFEENGMHSAPFEGFNYGIQTNRAIKKPVYRAFQLLKGAGDKLLETRSPSLNLTSSVFASWSTSSKTVSIFVSNFAPDGFQIGSETVNLKITGGTSGCYSRLATSTAELSYISDGTTNPHKAWMAMGSPSYPTKEQIDVIKLNSFPSVSSLPIGKGDDDSCFMAVLLEKYSAARIDVVLSS